MATIFPFGWRILPFGLALTSSWAVEVAPSGLLCDLLRWPEQTAISNPHPKFSWIVPAGGKRDSQTAYQIQVAPADAGFQSGNRLVWDSGRVQAADSINVGYRGTTLVSNRYYRWRVRVWQGASRPTPFSEEQVFRTGALSERHTTVTQLLTESEIPPITVVESAAGRWLLDYGKTVFGYLTLDVAAGLTAPLTIRYGEKLAAGHVDLQAGENIRGGVVTIPALGPGIARQIRVPLKDYVRPENSIRLPRNIGVILPIRYVEIEGGKGPPWPGNLTMRMVHYPFDDKESYFRSSDKCLNRIWDLCKYSIKATTYAGIYVDGDRERVPYEADAYIAQLGHYCVDREFAMARYTNEYLLAHPTWPTEWKFQSIFMAWADYMYTGDPDFLQRNYGRLRNLVELVDSDKATGFLKSVPQASGGRPNSDLVDWPEGERDNYVFTSRNTVENAFFYRALVLMERIAEALARPSDALVFATHARRLRAHFRDAFLDHETGLFTDGEGTSHKSIHANLFPLAFGLVEESERPAVLAYLEGRGMRCSVYAAQYLLEGLFKSGEASAALKLITDSTTDRSWAHMVNEGASITWEAWDVKYKPNLDWNHVWGAAPANILSRYVLGVRPLEPGFARALIAPELGTLTSVAGRVPTIRGAIELAVSRSVDRILVTIKRPDNLPACFVYPVERANVEKVTVDGTSVGATFEAGQLKLDSVPSGRVRIVIFLRSPASTR